MKYSAIPASMEKLPNWVARQGKIPYSINGKRAKVNTSSTWNTLQEVKAFLKGAPPAFNGLGLMLERKNKIICVDVDHCLEDGTPNRTATRVLDEIDTYTEISQSGTGLHLFGFGTMPQNSVKYESPADKGTNIEIYAGLDDNGQGGRFIALTADIYKGRKTINDIQKGIDWLLSKAPAEKAKAPDKDKHNIYTPVAINDNTGDTINVNGVIYTADEIPALIEQCQTGTKIFEWQNLFHDGNITAYDNDHSRGDSALCSILCFWCHGKPTLIDKVFRKSALMREKWDEKRQGAKTYGELTIENALKVWNGKKYTGMSAKPAFPHLTSKGTPLRNHSANFKALIEWLNNVTIRYNQLKHRLEITIGGKCWDVDNGITLLLDYCALYGLTSNTSRVGEWVTLIARQNEYSPVVDYLQDCYTQYQQLSDLYSPVDTLWKTLHLSATAQQNEPFLKKLFIKWLVSCVAIAHNTGAMNLQGVLVLKGGQGIGKTTFARKLLPAVGSDWFIEGFSLNTKDKDSITLATAFWIVELGEFSETFRKSSFDELKQFLTKAYDDIRTPYAKTARREPRRTAFIATVNDDTFLADKTGNRRYWVLDLESIDLDTPIDVNHLWGAVMTLWKSGKVNYGLTLEEIDHLNKINTHYERVTDMEQVLIDSLDWGTDTKLWQWLTPTALCTLLDVPNTLARKIGRALTALSNNSAYQGIRKKRTNRLRLYYLPPVSLSTCDNTCDDFDILTDDKE